MSIWQQADLHVRRFAIGEAIAFDHFGRAQELMERYVDAALKGVRS